MILDCSVQLYYCNCTRFYGLSIFLSLLPNISLSFPFSLNISLNSVPQYLSQLCPSISLSTLSFSISLNSVPQYLSQLCPSVSL